MSRSVNPGNTFALLREEASILKQKEKLERALQRKAACEAEVAKAVAQPKHISPKATTVSSYTLGHGQSWADVSDDEDEDYFNEPQTQPELNVEDYLSSSESESEDDEVLPESATAEPEPSFIDSHLPAKRTSTPPRVVPIQDRALSKKERKQKELEELDELLGDLGLVVESKTAVEASDGTCRTDVPVVSAGKKKKKPSKKGPADENEAVATVAASIAESLTEVGNAAEEPVVTLSREEAMAALKKGVVKKRKPASATSVLPASVLAEAKKKAEAKKAKQKKEKHFDR